MKQVFLFAGICTLVTITWAQDTPEYIKHLTGSPGTIGGAKTLSDYSTVYFGSFSGNLIIDGDTLKSFPDMMLDVAWIARLDRNGTVVWKKKAGATSSFQPIRVFGANTDANDNVYLGVGLCGLQAGFDTVLIPTQRVTGTIPTPYLVKFDMNGSFQWVRYPVFSDSSTFGDDARGIGPILDHSGNIYQVFECRIASGTVTIDTFVFSQINQSSDIVIVKYNANGQVIWAHRMGAFDHDLPIRGLIRNDGLLELEVEVQNFDGGNLTTLIGGNLYVGSRFRVLMDPNSGSVVSVASFPLNHNNNMFLLTKDDRYYQSRGFTGTLNIPPFSVQSAGSTDISFEVYRGTNFSPVRLLRFGGTQLETAFSAIVNEDHDVLAFGQANNGGIIGPYTFGTNDLRFMAKFDSSGTIIWLHNYFVNIASIVIGSDDVGYFYGGALGMGGSSFTINGNTFVRPPTSQKHSYIAKFRDCSFIRPRIFWPQDTTFCPGDAGIGLIGFGRGDSLMFNWLKNDTLLIGKTDSILLVDSPGFYKVIISSSTGCVDTSNAKFIHPVQRPLPPISLTLSDSVTLCEGDSLSVGIIGYSPSNIYVLNSTASKDTIDNQMFVLNTSGMYHVMIWDSLGCTNSSDTLYLAVDSLPVFQITLGDTLVVPGSYGYLVQWYRNDSALIGLSDSTCLPTATGWYKALVSDSSTGCWRFTDSIFYMVSGMTSHLHLGKGFNVYPNPTSGHLTFESSETSIPRKVLVYNYLSKIVLEVEPVVYPATEIDIADYPSGMYWLKVLWDDGNSGSIKVIKN